MHLSQISKGSYFRDFLAICYNAKIQDFMSSELVHNCIIPLLTFKGISHQIKHFQYNFNIESY